MRGVRGLAEQTPASRERFVDLLRALAIVAVVLGHWLISVVDYDPQGHIVGHSALPWLRWAYPLTWLLQVMPLFFIVGGYANAASLSSHRRRGGGWVTWLQDRAGRLVSPTTALLVVLAAGAWVAHTLHANPGFIRLVVWVASIPLWFLSAYLAVVAATPLMYLLHRRCGWGVLVVLVLLVALGDVARLTGHGRLGTGNFLVGWLAIHQIGFAWRDGLLRFRPGVGASLLVGGVAALAGLTLLGPYSISMIDVPGERLLNASPPTLGLLATTAFQLGLVVLLRAPAQRWLQRARPWRFVVAVNAIVLTVFLWHMTAVVLLAGLLHTLHRLPTPEAATTTWWLWRAPWLVMLVVVLTVLVAVFGRLEIRPRRPMAPRWMSRQDPGSSLAALLTVGAYGCVVAGLLANNLAPNSGDYPLGMPAAGLVAYLVGAGVLRLLRGLPATARAPVSARAQPPRRRARDP